jgi:DNA-binding LacI/PurR family transcriptional regulator
MKKIKIIDVAELAGVSKSTVSQYLNGRFDYMSEKTKQRVKAAVDELDYVPNPIARSLKMDKTKTIGVIVRDITGFYTSRTIRGIDDYCKTSEYNVLIYNTDFDPSIEAKSLAALYQLRVDGIIIASSGKNKDTINKYIDKGMPIVHFQLEHDGNEKNIIVSDYRKAAFEATEYLIQLGHQRICFVTQNFKNVKSRQERYLGYVDALKKYHILLDETLIQLWERESGFQESPEEILNMINPPTVFFTQHLAITTELLTV